MIGKAKLELIENGEVIKTQYEQNMITNAVADIYKELPLIELMSPGTNQATALGTPATQLYGGILLFNQKNEENPQKTILPSSGVKNIGYADGKANADVNNTLLGSYNPSLSGKTDDGKGYVHVWEFNTSQANGTIESLALTSVLGGGTGWDYSENPTNTNFFTKVANLSRLQNELDVTDFTNIIETENEYIIEGINTEQNYRVPIKKRTGKIYKHMKLNSAYGKIVEIKEEVLEQSIQDGWTYWWTNCTANERKITFVYKDIEQTSKNSLYIYDLDKMTESRHLLPFDISLGIHNAVIVKNNAYILADNKVIKLDLSNDTYSEHAVSITPSKFIVLDDVLVVHNNGQMVFLNLDLAEIGKNKMKDVFGTLVHVMSSGLYITSGYQLYKLTPYLASINNLSSPIIKTKNQTLRITYTIQEV